MLSVVNIFTFLWLFFWAIRSGYAMSRGDQRSIHFPIMVLFLFCGFPLLLDEVIGRPEYFIFPGFYLASRDIVTNYIYCAYMVFIPVFWLFLSRMNKYNFVYSVQNVKEDNFKPSYIKRLNKYSRTILFFMLISPFIAVLLSPDPLIYLNFSSIVRSQISSLYMEHQNTVSLFARFSVIAGAVFIATAKPRFFGKMPHIYILLVQLVFIFTSVWLQGKRALLAAACVFVILAFHYRGVLYGKKMFIAIGLALLVVLSYSFFFQSYTNRVSRTAYENFRVDYGRDDVIKMTIFSEKNPQSIQILEHRGQSLLFYATFFVPRDLWPGKPMPYAQYFTSGIFKTNPRFWGWGMTTSWLEEALANLGKAGFILGPLLIWLVCYLGDLRKNPILHMLTPLVACLLMAVEAIAFMPVILLWLLLLIQKKPKKTLCLCGR